MQLDLVRSGQIRLLRHFIDLPLSVEGHSDSCRSSRSLEKPDPIGALYRRSMLFLVLCLQQSAPATGARDIRPSMHYTLLEYSGDWHPAPTIGAEEIIHSIEATGFDGWRPKTSGRPC
ncbi:hypothetical protein TIFTF001_016616 [Ficus carica]|uniref:Uncharacterized protein n=1 Tax=Ficus carica TaxID=3494 RepID=A0AA88D8X6_FICCA|nr:hypothetical protein TIFTF001_016616 [Ficus carica]